MTMSKSQLGVIHIAKKKLGMTEEEYRALLNGVAGVDSSKDLDELGFDAVMQRFAKLGFKSSFRKKQYGYREGMATPDQLQYIRYLWSQYTGDYNESSLNHFVENKFGITNLRFLTIDKVGKIISALRAMSNRKKPKNN
ncbi:MAG: regulatory protein GemA [Pseudomonadota bacterium]